MYLFGSYTPKIREKGENFRQKKVTKCLILPNALHRYKVEVAQGLVVIRAVRDINYK